MTEIWQTGNEILGYIFCGIICVAIAIPLGLYVVVWWVELFRRTNWRDGTLRRKP